MEKENTELEAEGRRLKKKLDALKNVAFQLEALEKENSQLEQENLELRRSAESLRSAGAKAAQLEAENRELESEKSQLKRNLELLKASSKKTERLEVSQARQEVLLLTESSDLLKYSCVNNKKGPKNKVCLIHTSKEMLWSSWVMLTKIRVYFLY